jgi:predicted O-methyltransferase YrrM
MSGNSFVSRAFRDLRRRFYDLVQPIPVTGYAARSVIFPVQGDTSAASEYLINLALRAAEEARFIKLPELSRRIHTSQVDFTPIWPGEHYRLLAALVKLLQPNQIVEIGTLHGLSSMAMMKFLPPEGRITTFDIVPWDAFPETCLSTEDFADEKLKQELGDLADISIFNRHRPLIERTNLLFVDGPKDGLFEMNLLRHLETVTLASPLLVVFDDIRLWNMLKIWQSIARPKLDLTSFGHWSGTGLVEWKSD